MRKMIILLLVLWIFAGCEKNKSIKCEGLATAVQTDNVELVKQLISGMLSEMQSTVSSTDPDGHYHSYADLIDLLNNCGINAVGICYGCIDTLPQTSEIRISVGAGVGTIVRIIDLARDASGRFVCINMHS